MALTVDPALAERVRAWIAADPDESCRGELQALLDSGDEGELRERFDATLTFGTAGLRGRMRAGPNGMNVAVVRRAAAGLAAYLLEHCENTPEHRPTVLIGCDARHGSVQFAVDSARVMAAAGLRVSLVPPRMPTPVLAYAVRELKADAGVMVTASHNPAQDNGYKVYLGGDGGGAQIIPPADAEIEAAIAAAGPAASLPLSDDFEDLGPDIVRSYIQAVAGLTLTAERVLRIAYTPLHGVGGHLMLDVLDKCGFGPPAVVDEQFEPDPDFPTVAFPNPEEPGATDLLLELSARIDADIAIANDPDADRCAVAVGGRLLTGDELGLLLADHLITHVTTPGPKLVATTIVSSSGLAALARARGVDSATTLTGFKWLSRAGGEELLFAYEEALGYAVGLNLVRDKDGISAGIAVAELAAYLKARGLTLLDRLDQLAVELGLFATRQIAVRLTDPSAAGRAVASLLACAPTTLGGLRVNGVQDLMQPAGDLGPTEGVLLQLEGGRVIVRPSGTEPKIKAYLEVVIPPEVVAEDVAAARAAAAERLTLIASELRPLLT
jgi:phosphomannomutase